MADGRQEGAATGEFDNLQRSTLAERIYEQLRDAILAGELAGGAELSQVELARQFGVSRIPVREALNRLHAERLLTAEPFHGHTVRMLSADEVSELIEIRVQLECLGLRRSIHRLEGPERARLAELNERLGTETDPQRWLQGDWELHRRLVGPGTACAEFVDDIRRRIHRYLTAAANLGERHASAVDEHRGIIDAIADGDIELAEERLRRHILTTGEALIGLIEDL